MLSAQRLQLKTMLPNEFLKYPMRRHGMDHDRYEWTNIFDRKPIDWGDNKKVALMVTVPIEFFPLNQEGKPFKAPGGMMTNYPDFRHYTSRDYGNRVGIFRFFKIFQELGIRANMAVNAAVAERYPELIVEINALNHEIIGHGINMDVLHYGGLDPTKERSQIKTALETLRSISGQAVKGWISPAYSESFNTPDILTEFGVKYVGDWANDELPYTMETANGNLIAMPISQEINDRQIIINYHHSEDSFVQQIKDQYDYLSEESDKYGGRVLSIVVHPYIMGLPYRIKALKEALQYVKEQSNVFCATGSDLLNG